jgi:phosphate binding protein
VVNVDTPKKTMKTKQLAVVLGLLATLSNANADRLVIKGSDTLGAKLVPQLAEQFKAQHPGTTFDIAAEGSTTGIAAIIDGTAQIGMSSRRAKTSEVGAAASKGKHMKPTIVAFDGIAVIVNSANPIKGLTKKQVEQIFTGDMTDWSAVGGSGGKISVYTRNTSSGTYSDFKELAMKKRDYAPGSQKMAGNEQIAAEVGKEPKRRRLRRHGLHQSWRSKSYADRWRSALDQKRASAHLSLLAPHILLHERRPKWPGQGVCRFHGRGRWPANRSAGWICTD